MADPAEKTNDSDLAEGSKGAISGTKHSLWLTLNVQSGVKRYRCKDSATVDKHYRLTILSQDAIWSR